MVRCGLPMMSIQFLVDQCIAIALLQPPKAYLATSPPHWPNARGSHILLQRTRSVSRAAFPYKPLELCTWPIPHRQSNIWPLSYELEPCRRFSLVVGVGACPTPHTHGISNLHNFIVWSPILSSNQSINIYSLRKRRDKPFTCPIQTCIVGIMVVLTSAVLGAIPGHCCPNTTPP